MYNFPNQSYDEFELFLPKLEKLLVHISKNISTVTLSNLNA